ncbi:substrate-binding domain-containing protein [Aeromicrobium sp.]|uniref:substrate-binding domain-containing protein n=1 Tax=Aeromicrobium sp. TaxID=1871063 RepID=UPI0019CCA4BD|nr:substrate-binding domain-containing protein [Aeromicrobium sp.]MBC7631263.1 substrate-binding domain-containing protein [Aeromicrobium sp.]
MRTFPTRSTGATRRGRRTAAAGLALLLGLCLTACGKDDRAAASDGPNDSTSSGDAGVKSINRTGLVASNTVVDPDIGDRVLVGTLADPVPGVIQVDGAVDSLTPKAIPGYRGKSTQVTEQFNGETRAFQRLCVGEIDIVDSARPISPAEWASCRAQGLDIVQSQVAADAVVLGIKNETDIGTDCLNTDEVARIFESGSTINNWSQVRADLYDTPLRTGGPDIDSGVVRSFDRYVLGSIDPSLSNFRADYRASRDENQTREFVVGSLTDRLRTRNLASVAPKREQLRKQLRVDRQVWADANAEVIEAQKEQKKGIRTNRSIAARAADDRRVAAAFAARGVAITKVNFIKAKFKPVNERYLIAYQAQERLDSANGNVGLFRESFYAVYENLIRPFEIEVADDDGQQNCIFPSPQTIVTGQYPLSRQLLLTTTTRALKRPEVADFLRYYLDNSQAIALDNSVIALPDKDIQRQLDWINKNELPAFESVDGGPVQIVTAPTATTAVDTSNPQDDKPAR